jgi:hypothetical protein
MNAPALPPRKRIAFSTFAPARLARPPFSAWQEGGPERLALAGRPVNPVSLVLAFSAAVLKSRGARHSSNEVVLKRSDPFFLLPSLLASSFQLSSQLLLLTSLSSFYG